MNDRTEPSAEAAPPGKPAPSGFIQVREVKFGKLVQQPNGPVVSGFEHAITVRAADLPPDVVDHCRPDILLPVEANPLQIVEPWAHERGALIILPMLRTRVSPNERHWCIAARVRPYSERGVGQGGRPATLMSAWPFPAPAWVASAPFLISSLGTDLAAEPELGTLPAAQRMSRPPATVPARPVQIATVGELPRPAIIMINALIRGVPTKWTKETFPKEQDFLECLSIVYGLIPVLRRGIEPRALLSASSGLAMGPEHFLISYVRESPRSKSDTAPIPAAWQNYMSRSPGEAISEMVQRAEKRAEATGVGNDPGKVLFGHAGEDETAWAPDRLARAVKYYSDPGLKPQIVQPVVDTARASLQARPANPAQPIPRPPADPRDVRTEAVARSKPLTARHGTFAGTTLPIRPGTPAPSIAVQPAVPPRPVNIRHTLEEAAQKAQRALSGQGVSPPSPQNFRQPSPTTAQSSTPRIPPPRPSAVALNPDERQLLDGISGWFTRNPTLSPADTADVTSLLDMAERFATDRSNEDVARLRQQLNGRLTARHLQVFQLLIYSFADQLPPDVKRHVPATLGQALALLRPLFTSQDYDRARANNLAFKLTDMAVDHMLALGVLDDREMQGLIVGEAWPALRPVRGRSEWLEQSRPDDADRWSDLIDRSCGLQAWRQRYNDAARTRTRAEADVEAYSYLWRNEFESSHGPEHDNVVFIEALKALIHRTRLGYTPHVPLDELSGIIGELGRAGLHQEVITTLDEAQRTPLPSAANDVPGGGGDEFLRHMRRLLMTSK